MERPDSRLIRVFLSSTFVDFQEERSLLVQQVFPSLRRRARSREVEIVDVDLRWGVTAEQAERGETLPLCLGEIDRCRPYFISLLGERYGWVPPPDYYKPELLERQPWLKERMGGASVTELEILHAVLRNPEMAGHAFFYLRDPAYAEAQSEAGWVAENPAERQRLEALKARIRDSGFPVAEGLPSPQAIAERIEADLWQLIESRFPEQESADALEREDRRHSDYRRARTGLYLGGEPAIEQLERWIADGEQRILITGESGAGKSALIANWLEAHQQDHPQDLVHAHHLGCTNDASAVRPLLGRLIDTASKLLLQEQQISEPIQVPQDWWELVFKVGEVFALLSPWCQRQGSRWILVLDGLDRLAEEDQQALPWIPTTIPPGIHVVASTLDCPARTILQERQYRTHEIGPLGKAEQQQLIERYLSRYTKQLESGLQQRILAHPLAGSPLFLKVLLEELRQCACFDTLAEQLEFYRAAETIDGLYARVLERLERAGHGEATRKALTALWASRAGLSEEELLAITGLAPLQWTPIDLALEQALGRNGNRLVLDHDYLRKAVENRYLQLEETKQKTHSNMADWFSRNEQPNARKAEEWPWQLKHALRKDDLRKILINPSIMLEIVAHRGSLEVIRYWGYAREPDDMQLDDILESHIGTKIAELYDDFNALINFCDLVSDLLSTAGLFRGLFSKIKQITLEVSERCLYSKVDHLSRLLLIAQAEHSQGNLDGAEGHYQQALLISEQELGTQASTTLDIHYNLGGLYLNAGNEEIALEHIYKSLNGRKYALGENHPDTLLSSYLLGLYHLNIGELTRARELLEDTLQGQTRILGRCHEDTITTISSLISIYKEASHSLASHLLEELIKSQQELTGEYHPDCAYLYRMIGDICRAVGEYSKATQYYMESLDQQTRLLGESHPESMRTRQSLDVIPRIISREAEEVITEHELSSRAEQMDKKTYYCVPSSAKNYTSVVRFLPSKHEGEEIPWVDIRYHAFRGNNGLWYVEDVHEEDQQCPVTDLNKAIRKREHRNTVEMSLGALRQQTHLFNDICMLTREDQWNLGMSESVFKQRLRIKTYANIYIINDAERRDLEGKVLLYEIPSFIQNQIMDRLMPDLSGGKEDERLNAFDLVNGADFMIKKHTLPNGRFSYEGSHFLEPTRFSPASELVESVLERTHSLSSIAKFRTYDERRRSLLAVING